MFRRPPTYAGGPVIIDFPNEVYAKHAGETHVGSILPDETESVDPDTYDEGVDGGYVKLARSRIARRIPPLGTAVSFGGYGALYAVTPDWHPVVGPAGPDGLYLCAGFSGHGFKLSPAVGATVAAEILSDVPPYDFSILRPDRFQRGTKVAGRYAYSIVG
jgi:glycine/D-amino acid oxidase-like deaminating enzyme